MAVLSIDIVLLDWAFEEWGFPGNIERREKWFRSIGYTVNAYENKRICSDHFTENDYYICDIRFQNPSKRLKKTVIPSIFTQTSDDNTKEYSIIEMQHNKNDSVMDIHRESSMDIQHESSMDLLQHHTVPSKSTFDTSRQSKQSNKMKMFIKTGKYTTECLTRTEFVTNRSWMKLAKGLNYYKYLNKLLLKFFIQDFYVVPLKIMTILKSMLSYTERLTERVEVLCLM
ncbi:PREDICTED: uncharacterized protein LOC108777850 [Cyphomyrmex costatus]|uniref:uncharacterized protein LOC108777850 n=1 Tax=Cyphomyrmex costatus TaxID=456900 RepID=UPI0008522B5B|nr:PREDICTED: uncharacterized protein LOC108777850 [Cyphomyrmex costatus]